MQTETATVLNPSALRTDDRSRLRTFAAVTAFIALWFVCCRFLSGEWSFNEQYNYGWFVPFFAAYLFWERWRDRPEPAVPKHKISAYLLIALCSALLLPLRVFEIGSGDWRPLGWAHTAAVAVITLSTLYLSGGRSWLRHFSFPVLFFLIAVPWITPIETPIVQGFMRIIAAASAETLSLFGIPVHVQGNLLRLPSGVVGVSEACSGVRSFQTSLMIGLFFGEVNRLRLRPRLFLLAGAVGIGLVANYLRASALVLIAFRGGLNAIGRWHDIFGYAIVIVVFAGTMWLASRFEKKRGPQTDRPIHAGSQGLPVAATLFAMLLVWTVAVEVAAEFWYRAHERNLVARPSWSVRWPEKSNGYREIKVDSEVRNMLRYDSGREASWTSGEDHPGGTPSIFNYLFFFRWNSGSGTILRARAHRPDICLPATGWKPSGKPRLQNFQVADGFSLPFRRFDFIKETSNGLALHAAAFFTLHEDVSHEAERSLDDNAGLYSNWDWPERWRVVKDGIRNRGQQVLEVVMIEPETNLAAVDGEFAALVPQLIEPAKVGN